jgi:DNA modification methylase
MGSPWQAYSNPYGGKWLFFFLFLFNKYPPYSPPTGDAKRAEILGEPSGKPGIHRPHEGEEIVIICGDALTELGKLPDSSVQCCVTSPPYWGLRDYGVAGQLGLEKTPEEYVGNLVAVFREVRRVLRDDGTLWLNLGDSYSKNESNNGGYSGKSTLEGFTRPDTKGRTANETGARHKIDSGLKPKDLVGIPWRVAFALQADGWYLRSDIIWAKPNPMPESVKDRPTRSHEYIFLMSKNARYYYDAEAIAEESATTWNSAKQMVGKPLENQNGGKNRPTQDQSGRNRRSVWTIATRPFPEAHFATFPQDLVEPCIKAGCPVGGAVLDPFFGAGTTGLVAARLGREFIGIELNQAYCEMAKKRIYGTLGAEIGGVS